MTDDKRHSAPLATALEAARGFKWECELTDEFDHWLSDGAHDLNFYQDAEQGRIVSIYRVGAAASEFPQKPLATVEFTTGEWKPNRWTAIKEERRRLDASIAATYASRPCVQRIQFGDDPALLDC